MTNKREPYFMHFYKNVALLNQVYNVETKFLVQLMARSGADMVVHLNPTLKKSIMVKIGSDATNLVKAADKHLNSLKRKGVIVAAGRGSYMVDPKIHGYSNAHEVIHRNNAKFIELKLGHRIDGTQQRTIVAIDSEGGHV